MTNEMFRAIRLYLNMTQPKFADFLGVSPATVGRIESGSLAVTPRVQAKLAARFTIDDAFLSFFDNMRKISHFNFNTSK